MASSSSSRRLEPLRHIEAGVLNIAYYETGPVDGPAAILLHGFPYDIHSYVDVAPLLAAKGWRVILPYLRGYGPTRFLDTNTPRSGQQAAIGADLIALMDALNIPAAVFGGYDWGGRGACIGAALWPERCIGLVSVNGYLVQDIAQALNPARLSQEAKAQSARETEAQVKAAADKINLKVETAETQLRDAVSASRSEIEAVAASATREMIARLTGIDVDHDEAAAAVKAELNG